MTGTVALVDDDELFRESLAEFLSDTGLSVCEFADGAEFVRHIEQGGTADLVLLDWKMPRMSGIEVLRYLHRNGIPTPVILLTVLGHQNYEETALGGGALDFVEKGRSFGVLLKRIELIFGGAKAKLAGPTAASETPLKLDHLELDGLRRLVSWKRREVRLSSVQFDIVHCLATNADRVISYRAIYDLVHSEGFVAGSGSDGYRANVRMLIHRIRVRFREIDSGFDFIANYPGQGYRWKTTGP